MKKQIEHLQKQIEELQAFCGVLVPVFEKEYVRQKYNWEGKKSSKKAR